MTRRALLMLTAMTVGTVGCSHANVTVSVTSKAGVSIPSIPSLAVAVTAEPPVAPTPSVTPVESVPATDPEVMVDPGQDVQSLVATLDAAEHLIRDPSRPEPERVAAGRRQQLAYRRLAARPDWVDGVLLGVSPDVRDAVRANIDARVALSTIKGGGPARDVLPTWRIAAPPAVTDLLAWYHEAEARTTVAWEYLAAINLIESRMGRIEGTSSAGAQGPMQFLPSTWALCCTGDVNDPRDAIIGAATYLRDRGAPNDMSKALFGYNPTKGYVDAVQLYAAVLAADEQAFLGYYSWQVFVGTTAGDVRLPVGFDGSTSTDAATYLATHPQDRAPSITP